MTGPALEAAKPDVSPVRYDSLIRAALKQQYIPGIENGPRPRLIDELEVGGCIADVAVAGDDLHGYEIKAWGDSLSRFPLQGACYTNYFDYNTLVCTIRHAKSARKKYLDTPWYLEWGLVVAVPRDGAIEFEVEREAQLNPHATIHHQLQLLWHDEMRDLLFDLQAQRGALRNMATLRQRLKEVCDVPFLHRYVCECLQRREGLNGWRNADGTVIPMPKGVAA